MKKFFKGIYLRQILKILWQFLVLILLVPPSLLGLWSIWHWASTSDADRGADQTKFLHEQELFCAKKGSQEQIGRCMEDAYKSLGGGEAIIMVFAFMGLSALLILIFVVRSWQRKKQD